MNLEQIIRPFQDRDVTPPKKVLGTRKDAELISVDFGEGGDKIFLYSTFASTGVETVNDYVEVNRDASTKRVENPDDPEQYVEVERIEKLFTRGANDPSKRINIEFKNKD